MVGFGFKASYLAPPPLPCPLSGLRGVPGAPRRLLWGLVGPTFIPVLLARPEENSAGGRGIEVEAIAPAISPLNPCSSRTLTSTKRPKTLVFWMGRVGGTGLGGHHASSSRRTSSRTRGLLIFLSVSVLKTRKLPNFLNEFFGPFDFTYLGSKQAKMLPIFLTEFFGPFDSPNFSQFLFKSFCATLIFKNWIKSATLNLCFFVQKIVQNRGKCCPSFSQNFSAHSILPISPNFVQKIVAPI